jgi:apolipoprotein D and lipocalin family protein
LQNTKKNTRTKQRGRERHAKQNPNILSSDKSARDHDKQKAIMLKQQQPRKPLPILVAVFLAVATTSSIIFAVEAGGASSTFNNNNNNAKNCPPVPTVADLDIARYASKPWYVQAQLPNAYQPVENLFCVRAVYTVTSPTTLDVFNFARKGSVEGAPTNEDMVLNAYIPDVDVESKLKVGPKFVPRVLYGDYWIVAYEEGESGGWAIISGGQPTIEVSEGLCTTESADNIRNQGGLWLFTREKEVSPDLIEMMKKKANELGIDTSMLVTVQQTGCEYP